MKYLYVLLPLFFLGCTKPPPKFYLGDRVILLKPSRRDVFYKIDSLVGTVSYYDPATIPFDINEYGVTFNISNNNIGSFYKEDELKLFVESAK